MGVSDTPRVNSRTLVLIIRTLILIIRTLILIIRTLILIIRTLILIIRTLILSLSVPLSDTRAKTSTGGRHAARCTLRVHVSAAPVRTGQPAAEAWV